MHSGMGEKKKPPAGKTRLRGKHAQKKKKEKTWREEVSLSRGRAKKDLRDVGGEKRREKRGRSRSVGPTTEKRKKKKESRRAVLGTESRNARKKWGKTVARKKKRYRLVYNEKRKGGAWRTCEGGWTVLELIGKKKKTVAGKASR